MKFYSQCRVVGVAVFLLLQSTLVLARQNSFFMGAESFARDCYERSQNVSVSGRCTRLTISACDRVISDEGMTHVKLAVSYGGEFKYDSKTVHLASIEAKPAWPPVLDKLARVNNKLKKQSHD